MLMKIYNKIREPLAFVIKVLSKSSRDGIAAFSAQSAFFILMSVFPFTILLLQLMKIAPISQEDLLYAVDSIFPEYLLPTIHEILQEIYSSSFGMVAATGIAILWASSKAIYALQEGLGRICNERKKRNWLIVRARSLLYTLIVAVLMVIGVAMIVVWQKIRIFLNHYRPRGISLHLYSALIQFVYSLVLLTILLAVMYKAFPHKKLKFRDQLPGAFVAAVGLYGFSIFVAIYIGAFNGFSMYGSLTTLTLVMFWLYFCNYIVMVGAEVNEVLRRDREVRAAMEKIGMRRRE